MQNYADYIVPPNKNTTFKQACIGLNINEVAFSV